MKQVVVGVYDRAAQVFGRPFFVVARAQALRSFRDEVNRPDSEMGRHPEDFDLFQLAVYDDGAGSFELAHELIARGKDVVEVRQ